MAINKSSSKVSLLHKPTGVQVFCQDFRCLSENRELARIFLIDKLDLHYNGENSKIFKKQEKARKRKQQRKRKSVKKYTESLEATTSTVSKDEENLSFEEALLVKSRLGSRDII